MGQQALHGSSRIQSKGDKRNQPGGSGNLSERCHSWRSMMVFEEQLRPEDLFSIGLRF